MSMPKNLSGKPLYHWYRGEFKVIEPNESFIQFIGAYVAVWGDYLSRWEFAKHTAEDKDRPWGINWNQVHGHELPPEFRAALLLVGVPT